MNQNLIFLIIKFEKMIIKFEKKVNKMRNKWNNEMINTMLTGITEMQLPETENPQTILSKASIGNRPCTFAFRRQDAKIAWPQRITSGWTTNQAEYSEIFNSIQFNSIQSNPMNLSLSPPVLNRNSCVVYLPAQHM